MFERQLLLDYLPSFTKQMAADLSKGSSVFSYVGCKKTELHFSPLIKVTKLCPSLKTNSNS